MPRVVPQGEWWRTSCTVCATYYSISWLVDDAASVHTDVWGQACHCDDS